MGLVQSFVICILAAAAAGGCAAGDFTPRPNQEEAIDVVWRQLYGANWDAPPIGWRTPECGSPVKWFDGFTEEHTEYYDNGDCKGGRFYPNGRAIELAWRTNIFRTGLAHELYHAFLLDTTGDADGGHTSLAWKSRTNENPDGDGIVQIASRRLIDLRL